MQSTKKKPLKSTSFRVSEEDLANLERIRVALGVRSTGEAMRYALTQTERLVRGGKK